MNEYLTQRSGLPHTRGMPELMFDEETTPIYGPDGHTIIGVSRPDRPRDQQRQQNQRRSGLDDIDETIEEWENADLDPDARDYIIAQKRLQKKAERGEHRSSKDIVSEILRKLNAAGEDVQQTKTELLKFESTAKMVKRNLPQNSDQESMVNKILNDIQLAHGLNNVVEIRLRAAEIAKNLEDTLRPYEERKPQDLIHSIEELAEQIMLQEDPKWDTGGDFELVDREGNLHPENFLTWVRSKVWYWDDYSPDAPIQLFNQINIPTLFRQISFEEMLSNPKYWRRREVNQETGEERYVHDDLLDKLKGQALYEVWLFNQNHDGDANYRLGKGNEKKLFETLESLHYNDVFTKDRSRLMRMLKLQSVDELGSNTEASLDNKWQGIVGKINQRALLAYMYLPDRDMLRDALTRKGNTEGLDKFYESIIQQVFKEKMEEEFGKELGEEFGNDRKSLKKRFEEEFKEKNKRDPKEWEYEYDLFGKNKDVFFKLLTKKGDDTDLNYWKRNVKMTPEEFDSLIADKELFARKALLYRYGNTGKDEKDKQGNVIKRGFKEWSDKDLDPDSERNLRDGPYAMFNVYSDINTEEDRIKIMRNAVRAGVTTIAGLEREDAIAQGRITEDTSLDAETRERRKLARLAQDVEYGEMWAFKQTYWTGIAAYNDLGAIAFDKWGQELNTGNYRKRQAAGRGPSGIEDTVWGINRLGLNFWQGLKVKSDGGRDFDKILIEALQGGDGHRINLDEDIQDFDFQGNAQKQYMADHIVCSYKLAGFLIDRHGFNFDQFLKYDYRGKLVIDWDKAQEVIQDSIWHDLRYTFDQRGFLWDNNIRTWLREDYTDPVTGEKKQRLRFGNVTLKEHMFDKEVLDTREKMFERADKNREDYSKRVEEEKNANAMARGILAYLVGKEIKWHMKDRPGSVKYGLHEIETIKNFFSTWSLGLEKDEKGNVIPIDPFFSGHEWEEIEEMGGADTKKLKRNLIFYLLSLFFAQTIWGTLKESRKIATDAGK